MFVFGYFTPKKEFLKRLEQCQGRLHRLALSWCHNRALAEDLAQEALSKAMAKSDHLRDLDSMESWLFSILSNCLNDHYRRHREFHDIDEVEERHLTDEATPDDQYRQSEMVSRVRRAIAQLPVGQRQVLTLVDLEQLSYLDVAQILDVPVGTVMSRLSRARLALKEQLLKATPAATENQNLVRIK
ncbi:MAG: RNA polymerase sigma factor [Gammaproteobacteria bacterium]|nr:RNA polymerase sigma factor [Gammaproteobacteria bacterium]MBU1655922.1 RNA polymerase sigma factor [Gammaproteobacteria bacterium]MBU1961794.1 RNA polymerase sigma factor [Gammaproteobacteria bacterium]